MPDFQDLFACLEDDLSLRQSWAHPLFVSTMIVSGSVPNLKTSHTKCLHLLAAIL